MAWFLFRSALGAILTRAVLAFVEFFTGFNLSRWLLERLVSAPRVEVVELVYWGLSALVVALVLYIASRLRQSHSALVDNVFAKLTKDDRYLLAVEFKELKRSEFSLPHGRHGIWGHMSLEEARSRISRMVDLGVLQVTSRGTYELTQVGTTAIKDISADDAYPEGRPKNASSEALKI